MEDIINQIPTKLLQNKYLHLGYFHMKGFSLIQQLLKMDYITKNVVGVCGVLSIFYLTELLSLKHVKVYT